MRLVLWDVDGTLVDAAGFGWYAYEEAFAELFGEPLAAAVPMAGRTDRAIMIEAFEQHGITDPTRIAEFQENLVKVAWRDRELLRGRGGRALPGAAGALAALAERPEVVSTLLTGNLRGLAAVKLAAVDLDQYLDLEIGAYGDDHECRADLVAVARRLAGAKYQREFPPQDVVLVGDTPLDVAAGLSTGATVVAVATGRYSEADLVAAGAVTVFEDLVDTAAVLSAILRTG